MRSVKKGGVAIVFSIAPILLYYYLGSLMSTVNGWLVFLLCILAGMGLFLFREYNKAAYGLTEILVAIFSLAITLDEFSSGDYTEEAFRINIWFKALACLYVMVRGLDNLVKGIKGTRWGVILKERYDIGNN